MPPPIPPAHTTAAANEIAINTANDVIVSFIGSSLSHPAMTCTGWIDFHQFEADVLKRGLEYSYSTRFGSVSALLFDILFHGFVLGPVDLSAGVAALQHIHRIGWRRDLTAGG